VLSPEVIWFKVHDLKIFDLTLSENTATTGDAAALEM